MKRIILTFFLLSSALLGCQAPTSTAPLQERQDIVRGELANGLRYIYIQNERPANRVSMQLVVHAGSLDEADDQRGIAHLVEHMAFNGTTAFPANQIIEHQESLGMVFGRDVNAMTEYYTTSYFLHLPNSSDEMLDEGFHMLAQQASALVFDPKELEMERPVVEEEWRRGRNMMARLGEANRKVLLARSRFGDRDPIGDMDLVRHVDAKRIQAFWQDWYHPNNMTMIVVGSASLAQVTSALERHFASLESKTLPPRPELSVPLNSDLSLHRIEDAEISTEVLSFNFRAEEPIATDEQALRQQLVNQLTMAVLNKRLREFYQSESEHISKLIAMSRPVATGYRNNRVMALLNGHDYHAASQEAFSQLSRFATHGFSQSDLNSERASLLARQQQMADSLTGTTNRRVLMSVFNHLRSQKPITDPAVYAAQVSKLAATIQLDEINAHLKQMLDTQAPIVIAQIKPENSAKLPNARELNAQWQYAMNNPADKLAPVVPVKKLMQAQPKPVKVVSHRIEQGVHIWQLENGSQVWFEPSDETPNQLLIRYQGWGGSEHLAKEQRRAAHQARHLSKFGYAGLSQNQLAMVNAGTSNRMMIFVRQDRHGMLGNTNAQDLENWLQNLYLQITATDDNPEQWQTTKALLERGIRNRHLSADGQFNLAIDKLRFAHNPTRITMTEQELSSIQSSDILSAWQQLFGSANEHQLVVVGNAKPEQVIELASRYVGNLPSSKAFDEKPLPPLATGTHQVRVQAGQEPLAVTSLLFNYATPYRYLDDINAGIASRVISTRLRESLREAAGGVYSVRFGIRLDRERSQGFGLLSYTHAPERADELLKLSHHTLEKIKQQGISQSDLDQALEQMKTGITEETINDRQRISWLKEAALYQEPISTVADYHGWLNKVELSEVNQLIQQALSSPNWIDARLMPQPATGSVS